MPISWNCIVHPYLKSILWYVSSDFHKILLEITYFIDRKAIATPFFVITICIFSNWRQNIDNFINENDENVKWIRTMLREMGFMESK